MKEALIIFSKLKTKAQTHIHAITPIIRTIMIFILLIAFLILSIIRLKVTYVILLIALLSQNATINSQQDQIDSLAFELMHIQEK